MPTTTTTVNVPQHDVLARSPVTLTLLKIDIEGGEWALIARSPLR